MENYKKAVEFIETAPEESLKDLLLDLMFYNPDSFIENFIVNENDL